ncbi:MAG: epsG [Bacillales bacterium]|nr:epsG [Bacillales bacterium]
MGEQELSSLISSFFYISLIVSASFFAFLSQNQKVKQMEDKFFSVMKALFDKSLLYLSKKFFGKEYKIYQNSLKEREYSLVMLFVSFLILTIPVAFRHFTGADYAAYVDHYESIKEKGASFFIHQNLEVGYVWLNVLCSYLFNSYKAVFIIMAILTNIFFFKGMTFESKKISLGTAVFVYGFSLYFWGFIIIRNLLAISIVFFALRYLFEKKPIRYFILVTTALLFHYSMAVFFVLGILYLEKLKKCRIVYPLIILLMVPFAREILLYVVKGVELIIPKIIFYSSSFNELSVQFGMNVYVGVFWLLVYAVFYKKLIDSNDHISLYFSFFFITVILSLFTISTPIFTRFIYALLPAQILLMGSLVRLFDKRLIIKIVLILFIFVFGINETRHFINEETYHMLPYKTIFSKH